MIFKNLSFASYRFTPSDRFGFVFAAETFK